MSDPLIEIPGYTIHGQLGKGGMAEVYLATQNSLQRKVAIKVLSSAAEHDFIQRFINEGHIVASLNHPAIITIYDIDKLEDGRYYLAMEFIAGGDLSQYQGQVLAPARALEIVRQVAEGLSVVHERGLVHRDIKPANILFRGDGSVVITDFGVAKDLAIDNDLTHFGVAVGSPAYSSPEQAQCEVLDQRSDIYSLGIVLLEMLSGANQFRGASYTQTVMNHVQMAVPSLPAALQGYQALLERMLAKTPDARFASCRELLQALAVLQDDDLGATQFSPALKLAKAPAPKQRARPLLMLLLGVLLLAGLGYGGYTLNLRMQVADLLAQAEQCLLEDKLQEPLADNAEYFFQQVLLLDAANIDAQLGLQRVLAARVARFNGLAEQRFASAQVSLPAEDSALWYFRQALSLAPEDPTALAGIVRVADWHLQAVHDAYRQRQFSKALEQIELGLQAAPEHAELLKLRAAHAAYVKRATQRAKPRAVASKPAARTQDSDPGAAQKPAGEEGNPLSRLWNHILNNGLEE